MARAALTLLGVVLVLAGALWALQGAGVVMWPASSFMLQQQSWITYGAVTALVGLVLIALGRRMRR